MEYIAITSEQDEILGYKEKLYVHEKGILHRAFSIIIYDKDDNMLIQKRSSKKYHSPSLWTNSCCSHQRKSDNSIIDAAKRRLNEELGIKEIELIQLDKIKYKCHFDNGLIENEIDYVFIGVYNGEINFNKNEIDDLKWIDNESLFEQIERRPNEFTYWFKILVKKIK